MKASGAARGFAFVSGAAAVVALTSISTPLPALAQQAPAAQAQGKIEEIVVTSRKREESAQDIPVAVTAFKPEDIARVQPRTLRDFDGLAPNVFIGRNTAGPSAGAIYIRGLGYGDIEKTQSPAVGLIIDGIYQGTSTGQLIDTFDVSQVEINRGPQGVLYGKNTTGGTIVVKRTKPTGEWGLRTSASYGNYDRREFKAIANAPIIDNVLALKVGGNYKEQDGYYDNVLYGEDEGDENYWSTTASLLFTPTETLDAELTYDRLEDTSDMPPTDPRVDGPDPFENKADFDEDVNYLLSSWGLQAHWSTPFGTLTSITGWIDSNDRTEEDFDGSSRGTRAIPIVQLHSQRDQSYTQFTEELRFNGQIIDQLRYTVGGYWFESDLTFSQFTSQYVQIPNPTSGAQPCTALGLITNPNPAIGNTLCQQGPSQAIQFAGHDVESKAAFANVSWDVTPELELSLGGRYLKEEKDFDNVFYDLTNPNAETTRLAPQTESWDDFILTGTANWQVTPHNLIYAKYGEGFRSGGFSIRASGTLTCPVGCTSSNSNIIDTSPQGTPVIPAPVTFEPEEVWSAEVGSKNDLFNNRLRMNFAAYYTELDGPQFSSIITTPGIAPGTDTLINNADEQTVVGIEATIEALITQNFTLRLNGGAQNAERSDFSIDGTRLPLGPNGQSAAPGSVSIGSEHVARSPDWNYSITGIYTRNVGPGQLTANASVNDRDGFPLVSSVTGESILEKGYALVDASLAYAWTTSGGTNWRLSVWGKNLTDEEYRELVLPLGQNGGYQNWGPPRTGAVELEVDL